MGFITDIFTGGADDAAKGAAAVQAQSGAQAIAASERALAQSRQDLAPFRRFGSHALQSLEDLTIRPEYQAKFLQNSPFYKTLADDAQRRIFDNQAARGKLGSGETASALQRNMVLMGQDLIDRNIRNRLNLATLGANAAAGQATATQNMGTNIADLNTQIGNSQASGLVGAANARAQGVQSAVGTGLGIAGLFVSDARLKRDIVPVGHYGRHRTYRYRYVFDDREQFGVMAQEVEAIQPEAVINIGGVKFVDYGALSDAA